MATLPRVASLLPSATEIMGHLKLQHLLVGVSHECDVAPEKSDLDALLSNGTCVRLTSSEINPMQMSQEEINTAVMGSLRMGDSLYGILESEFCAAKPTVVLTQALCDVCAPSAQQVAGACGSLTGSAAVVNLEPHNLADVAQSFIAVSQAVTGSSQEGESLAARFQNDIHRITSAVSSSDRKRPRSPRCMLLEWVEPLFDGGHWIPDMLVAAGGERGCNPPGQKSKQFTPSALVEYDPDCILVACCGFDLQRNLEDAQKLWSKSWWTSLRCVKEGRVFAADGNRYFARPGPSLVAGVAILARIMHEDPVVIKAIEATELLPPQGMAWDRIQQNSTCPSKEVKDIEDLCWSLHQAACDRGERYYTDPATGYQVMTEVAHKKRGKCCGCGCRHCPFNHAGVASSERAARIQQPAWLHKAASAEASEASNLLFWSGGKDSFLTLRAMQREAPGRDIVLITTFDARTRVIAHQEVDIQTVVRQAQVLGVSLLGVPLHPGRKYEEHIKQAFTLVKKALAGSKPVFSVCFGDLHLEYIRSWREKQLTPIVREVFGDSTTLQYPIWKKPYEELMADLMASGVECRLSAVPDAALNAPSLCVGALFSPELAKQAADIGWDAFGENGEFHSVVEPWISKQT